jgi:hypothetical protein
VAKRLFLILLNQYVMTIIKAQERRKYYILKMNEMLQQPWYDKRSFARYARKLKEVNKILKDIIL